MQKGQLKNTLEVLNSPLTASQQVLYSILEELRVIRTQLDGLKDNPADLAAHRVRQDRPAA